MASSARIDELKKKFDENQRRYFAPLANEFRKAGDLEQAILICEQFLPEQPGHMSGHIVYGQALYEFDRLDESRTVFETALSLDPENLIALRHLGDIAGRQGDAAIARRWYERVLEADPRNEEIQGLIAGLHGAPSAPAGDDSYGAPEPSRSQEFAAPPLPEHASFDEPAAVPASEAEDRRAHDLDVTLVHGMPAIPEPNTGERTPAVRESVPPQEQGAIDYGEISLDSLVPMDRASEQTSSAAAVAGRADGFEATEFQAPDDQISQAPGLQSAYEDETSIFGAAVTPPSATERSHHIDPAFVRPAMDAFGGALAELPEDDGTVLPPHGDPVAHPSTATTTSDGFPSLDEGGEFDGASEFEMPSAAPGASSGPVIPTELPPEVIAAEAELTELNLSFEDPVAQQREEEREDDEASAALPWLVAEPEPSAAQVEDDFAPAPAQRPFVTETMAELYLKQGFRDQALSVYQQLSAASPDDSRLSARVQTLTEAAEAAQPAAGGPTVREFFARFASLRPGERAAAAAPPADGDFDSPSSDAPPADAIGGESAPIALDPHVELPVAESEPRPVEASTGTSSAPVERAAAPQQSGGTIDALFGNRPSTTSEDSAASALSQAFGAGSEPAPAIGGHPARRASEELSLDSVFREGSPRGRASQGFSFDQFFSQNAEGEKTGGAARAQEPESPGEPAEKSADDIEQFNSWLQGLKQR
jgi:tetratricopeptide (TPR) repeat protein